MAFDAALKHCTLKSFVVSKVFYRFCYIIKSLTPYILDNNETKNFKWKDSMF